VARGAFAEPAVRIITYQVRLYGTVCTIRMALYDMHTVPYSVCTAVRCCAWRLAAGCAADRGAADRGAVYGTVCTIRMALYDMHMHGGCTLLRMATGWRLGCTAAVPGSCNFLVELLQQNNTCEKRPPKLHPFPPADTKQRLRTTAEQMAAKPIRRQLHSSRMLVDNRTRSEDVSSTQSTRSAAGRRLQRFQSEDNANSSRGAASSLTPRRKALLGVDLVSTSSRVVVPGALASVDPTPPLGPPPESWVNKQLNGSRASPRSVSRVVTVAVSAGDRRFGGKAEQKLTLEEKLNRYQDNRTQLETLQAGLSKAAAATKKVQHVVKSGKLKVAARQWVLEGEQTPLYGCTPQQIERARKALLVKPVSRNPKQVEDIVNWTMSVDLFYGMSMQARKTLCQAAECETFEDGAPVLCVGDALGGIVIIFDGACVIYIDASGKSAGQKGTSTSQMILVQHQKDRKAQKAQKAALKSKGAVNRHSRIKQAAAAAGPTTTAHTRNDGGNGPPTSSDFLRRRRAGLSNDSYLPPVQMRFGSGDSFGVQRAFHNLSIDEVRKSGYKTVSHMVQAIEGRAVVMRIIQPAHLLYFKDAYQSSQDAKVKFLKTAQALRECPEDSIVKMASMSRRQWFKAGLNIAREGTEADAVYFCMRGKVKVVKNAGDPNELVLNVLGQGACFGDWGVANGERRGASIVAVTDTEFLVVNAFNFKAALGPTLLQKMSKQGKEVAKMGAQAASDGITGGVKRNIGDAIRLKIIADQSSVANVKLLTRKQQRNAAKEMIREHTRQAMHAEKRERQFAARRFAETAAANRH
jgi:CRP-like cAMP-binding protein